MGEKMKSKHILIPISTVICFFVIILLSNYVGFKFVIGTKNFLLDEGEENKESEIEEIIKVIEEINKISPLLNWKLRVAHFSVEKTVYLNLWFKNEFLFDKKSFSFESHSKKWEKEILSKIKEFKKDAYTLINNKEYNKLIKKYSN